MLNNPENSSPQRQTPGGAWLRTDSSLIQGEGAANNRRVICVIHEHGGDAALAQSLQSALSSKARVLWIETEAITAMSWQPLTGAIRDILSNQGVRQAAFVTFGSAGTLLQSLCLSELKLVRSAVLVDASTRPHPTRISRIVDWLESHLPLGLPFRLRQVGFDGLPFLHRIRCPVLLVTTPHASALARSQSAVMAARLPTAWLVPLEAAPDLAKPLTEAAIEFYDVPARCPQKGLGKRGES